MKRFLCLLCALASLSLLPACAKQSSYRNDLSISALTESVRNSLNHQIEYKRADASYLDDYFKRPDFVQEQDIYFASDGNNLNEFGIFRVAEGKAEEMENHLRSYLSASLEKNRDFYDSYIPKETAKLRDAEVRRFGNYVSYAILDKTSRGNFFSAIEESLKQK